MAQIKDVTCMCFENQAEDAARFYTSIFPDAKMGKITMWPEGGFMPTNTPITVEFTMFGRDFVAVNANTDFHFTDAVSIQVICETQEEIDLYWDKLQAGGGKPVQCGWLKDKFGVSWQVTPAIMRELLGSDDKEKAARAMKVMMSMVKLDIAALKKAYNEPDQKAA